MAGVRGGVNGVPGAAAHDVPRCVCPIFAFPGMSAEDGGGISRCSFARHMVPPRSQVEHTVNGKEWKNAGRSFRAINESTSRFWLLWSSAGNGSTHRQVRERDREICRRCGPKGSFEGEVGLSRVSVTEGDGAQGEDGPSAVRCRGDENR